LRGADLLVYPTAIGWHPGEKDEWGERQREAWRTIQRSHAVANNLYVAAVNRVGVEKPLSDSPDRPASYKGIEFWGDSFVAGPMGEVLARAGDSEENLLVECDFDKIEQIRRNWPFLRDRRIDAYSGLERRYLDV
jgi:N-carbamoylputrescine amidase